MMATLDVMEREGALRVEGCVGFTVVFTSDTVAVAYAFYTTKDAAEAGPMAS